MLAFTDFTFFYKLTDITIVQFDVIKCHTYGNTDCSGCYRSIVK